MNTILRASVVFARKELLGRENVKESRIGKRNKRGNNHNIISCRPRCGTNTEKVLFPTGFLSQLLFWSDDLQICSFLALLTFLTQIICSSATFLITLSKCKNFWNSGEKSECSWSHFSENVSHPSGLQTAGLARVKTASFGISLMACQMLLVWIAVL